MVSRPTWTAVRASISTPVRPRVSAWTVQRTQPAPSRARTRRRRASAAAGGTAGSAPTCAWPPGSPRCGRRRARRPSSCCRRDRGERRGLHADAAGRAGDAVGLRLAGHVDHVGAALGVEMGQARRRDRGRSCEKASATARPKGTRRARSSRTAVATPRIHGGVMIAASARARRGLPRARPLRPSPPKPLAPETRLPRLPPQPGAQPRAARAAGPGPGAPACARRSRGGRARRAGRAPHRRPDHAADLPGSRR
jgi:hypothetical protein